MKIEFNEDETHAALVDWLKLHRPEVYSAVEGHESVLFCEVSRGEFVKVGFEVDD